MKRKAVHAVLILFSLMSLSGASWADIKVKTKNTMSGHSTESTVYIKGARQRTEMSMGPGMTMTTIMQCDQKRVIQVNDRCKVYIATPFQEGEEPEAAAAAPPAGAKPAAKPATARKGGVLTFSTSATDTGERQQMFGYNASHIKSTMSTESSPDACSKSNMRMEADGWYANLSYGLTCSAAAGAASARSAGGEQPDCQDRIRFRSSGGPKLGYPLKETRTMSADGGQKFTMTTETVELTKATLDPTLFDVPAGYREAKNQSELMCMPDVGAMMAQMQGADSGQMAEPMAAARPKQAGRLRVGVVELDNQAGASVSTEALRQQLIREFDDLEVDAVPLGPGSLEQARVEGREKECDYVLFNDILKVKQSGGKLGGMFGRATGLGGGKYEAQVNYKLYPISEEEGLLLEDTPSVKEEADAEGIVAIALKREAREVVTEIHKDLARRKREGR